MSRNADMNRVARLDDEQLLDLALGNDLAATAELYHRYFHFAWNVVSTGHGTLDSADVIAEAFRQTFEAARTASIDFGTTLSDAIRALVQPVSAPRRTAARRRVSFGSYFRGAVLATAA